MAAVPSTLDVDRKPSNAAPVTTRRAGRLPVGDIARYALLIVLSLLFLFPFYLMVRNALMTQPELSSFEWAWWPEAPQWSNLRTLFENREAPMGTGLRNSAIIAVVNLLLLFINAFQAFDEFFNIMGGTAATQGNRGLARPPLVYLYEVAFNDQNYGAGSAGAFILTAIIIGVTIIQGRIFGFGRAA